MPRQKQWRRLQSTEDVKGSVGITSQPKEREYHRHYTLVTANRWFAQRYNANRSWIFNGSNGNLNNNNVNNSIRSRAVVNLQK